MEIELCLDKIKLKNELKVMVRSYNNNRNQHVMYFCHQIYIE